MRHNQSEFAHTPVLYREVLEYIKPVASTGSAIVDCTLGEGGHSELFLKEFPSLNVIAFERDPVIIEIARKRLAPFGDRFRAINSNFSSIDEHLSGLEDRVSAILYDFGISSFHYDRSGRGFTYAEDEPLDMRLEGRGQTAADIVNNYDFADLARVFGEYGEERWAGRIARRIVEVRERQKITTSKELADIVLGSIPKRFHVKNIHPATRVFQGLRIEVNSELSAIEKSLAVSYKYVAPGGRILAISFHSLEDRIAKNVFKDLERGCSCKRNDLCTCDRVPKVKILTKKPLEPLEDEIETNRRARSAKLRVCERI